LCYVDNLYGIRNPYSADASAQLLDYTVIGITEAISAERSIL